MSEYEVTAGLRERNPLEAPQPAKYSATDTATAFVGDTILDAIDAKAAYDRDHEHCFALPQSDPDWMGGKADPDGYWAKREGWMGRGRWRWYRRTRTGSYRPTSITRLAAGLY